MPMMAMQSMGKLFLLDTFFELINAAADQEEANEPLHPGHVRDIIDYYRLVCGRMA